MVITNTELGFLYLVCGTGMCMLTLMNKRKRKNIKVEFFPTYVKKGSLISECTYIRMHDRVRITNFTVNCKTNNFHKIFPKCIRYEGVVTSRFEFDVMEKTEWYNDICKKGILKNWLIFP